MADGFDSGSRYGKIATRQLKRGFPLLSQIARAPDTRLSSGNGTITVTSATPVIARFNNEATAEQQQNVIDRFGAAGVSDDARLAATYAGIRTLRLADGPDEVHRRAIARLEYKKHK